MAKLRLSLLIGSSDGSEEGKRVLNSFAVMFSRCLLSKVNSSPQFITCGVTVSSFTGCVVTVGGLFFSSLIIAGYTAQFSAVCGHSFPLLTVSGYSVPLFTASATGTGRCRCVRCPN